jgi:hypothetical protein
MEFAPGASPELVWGSISGTGEAVGCGRSASRFQRSSRSTGGEKL